MVIGDADGDGGLPSNDCFGKEWRRPPYSRQVPHLGRRWDPAVRRLDAVGHRDLHRSPVGSARTGVRSPAELLRGRVRSPQRARPLPVMSPEFEEPLCTNFRKTWPGQECQVIVSGHRTTCGPPFGICAAARGAHPEPFQTNAP